MRIAAGPPVADPDGLGTPAEELHPQLVEAGEELRVRAHQQREGLAIHLRIDASWQHQLSLGEVTGRELRITADGLDLHLDAWSAARADGHGGLAQRAGRGDHVVEQHRVLALDVADDVHDLDRVRPGPALVHQREIGGEPGDQRLALAGIGDRHDHLDSHYFLVVRGHQLRRHVRDCGAGCDLGGRMGRLDCRNLDLGHADVHDGRNVVFHEFAHQLDFLGEVGIGDRVILDHLADAAQAHVTELVHALLLGDLVRARDQRGGAGSSFGHRAGGRAGAGRRASAR